MEMIVRVGDYKVVISTDSEPRIEGSEIVVPAPSRLKIEAVKTD